MYNGICVKGTNNRVTIGSGDKYSYLNFREENSDTRYFQIDCYGLGVAKTGRVVLGYDSNVKSFYFNSNGSITDGNGVDTSTLSNNVSSLLSANNVINIGSSYSSKDVTSSASSLTAIEIYSKTVSIPKGKYLVFYGAKISVSNGSTGLYVYDSNTQVCCSIYTGINPNYITGIGLFQTTSTANHNIRLCASGNGSGTTTVYGYNTTYCILVQIGV